MLRSIVLLSVVLAGCANSIPPGDPAERAKYTWLEPKGWDNRSFPFPLYFSDQVKHAGVEELRLSPGFFKLGSPENWSYAFAWWLTDARPVNEDTLREDLPKYYRGLCATDGPKALKLEPSHYSARVLASSEADPSAHRLQPGYATYRAQVDSYECLSETTRGEPITLAFRVRTFGCPNDQRRVALFAISPQPDTHPIWRTLMELVDTFRCDG